MRKQELFHLHGLLEEVCRYCERTGDPTIDVSGYESLETGALSIYLTKVEQQEAIFALSEAITDGLLNEQAAVAAVDAN